MLKRSIVAAAAAATMLGGIAMPAASAKTFTCDQFVAAAKKEGMYGKSSTEYIAYQKAKFARDHEVGSFAELPAEKQKKLERDLADLVAAGHKCQVFSDSPEPQQGSSPSSSGSSGFFGSS